MAIADFSPDNGSAAASQAVKALLRLREMILAGELEPGRRISELWVVDKLAVSRTPVRAALARLQEEGLLEAIPSGGFAIRSFTETEICDSIELRGCVEGLAARLAAERGVRQTLLRDLEAAVSEIDGVLAGPLDDEKFSAYVGLNERFHRLLAASAQSPVIERQIDKCMRLPFASASAFVRVQAIDERAREMLLLAQAQHRSVVEAIENREGARAEALMREHSRIAHRNLKTALNDKQALDRLPGGALIRHG